MGFEALLGNERLKETLSAGLNKGHISHFYLISGPRGSGKRTLARLLASAILCEGSHKGCGVCGPCRKLANNNHPDFITVEDPEHKNVAVKIVRQVREDVFIKPNESAYKIYLFPQELGIEGQNALLKILEEPPKHGVFLLLTDNPEKLLTTVRSRCTELKLQALPDKLLHRQLRMDFPEASEEDISSAMERSGGFLGQAKEILSEGGAISPQTENFVRFFAARDSLGLTQTVVPMEKWKRDALLEQLSAWKEILEQAFACRTGGAKAGRLARTVAGSRSSAELLDAVKNLDKAMVYCQSNVSPAAVCGWLQWKLK
jgi:DNA polymerase-3 subunit delta'